MKRLIACVSLVAAATTAAVPSTAPSKPTPNAAVKAPAKAQPSQTAAKATKTVAKAPKCRVAPADEYFGKLKMSILGIRNTIKDQGLKVDVDPAKAPSTGNAIALTEDAIHDWQHKYPCDSWLPGTLLGLERFYLKIHTDDGVKHVHATFAWLRHDYPRSNVVQVARREDGQATVVPASPAMASVPSGTGATDTASPSPAQPGAPVLMPGQAPATPYPGTAPQSVINAQNAMGSPSPSPTPRR